MDWMATQLRNRKQAITNQDLMEDNDYDYQTLWNTLINTLASTIEFDEKEDDVEFLEALHGLIDATRKKI